MAMTEEETRKVVEVTVREVVPHVVKETLTAYGIDASNPIEVQKDQQHLRKWRLRLDSAGGKVFLVSVMAVFGICTQLFGAGFTEYLKGLIS